MKSVKQNKNREIVEEAKAHRKKKQMTAMFEGEDYNSDRVFDVRITVRDDSLGYEGKGLNLFSIDRKGIDIFELKRLVENIEEISDKVDLEKFVDKELRAEQDRDFKKDLKGL